MKTCFNTFAFQQFFSFAPIVLLSESDVGTLCYCFISVIHCYFQTLAVILKLRRCATLFGGNVNVQSLQSTLLELSSLNPMTTACFQAVQQHSQSGPEWLPQQKTSEWEPSCGHSCSYKQTIEQAVRRDISLLTLPLTLLHSCTWTNKMHKSNWLLHNQIYCCIRVI